jgi:hypothetical protein
MHINLRAVCVAAVVVVGSTTITLAQGGQTDRNGNSMGSQHVGSGRGATGKMVRPSGTVGSANTVRSERDAPNGSSGAPPKAKVGPQGDPSKDEDAPK